MSTWILLRGLTRESAHWGGFPELLRARLPDARVVAIDLPGNGRWFERPSPTRIEAVTDHCRQELRDLGLRPPYRLLAMSLGAMVAVDWAATHSDELDACVLINTSLRPWSPWYQRLRPANYAALLGLLLTVDARRRERTVLRLTTRHALDEAGLVAQWANIRRERPVSAVNALRQLLSAARYRAPARAPAVPMLVLSSRGDGLVDPRCSERLTARWKADEIAHPTAGHDLALDDGPWVAWQIAHWLQAQGIDPA
jgi:pimeloyl-ACP methyl ester carboxylesterase